ncbi:MAG: glutamine synthetase [Hyphomicrobiaceae bacterium]|nr:glutamine synthetase [Hyphomicrobiaceae bacterium]MCC0024443.1 glutamine synthetase [Hyphomicrobiaceae bacterium]
MSFLQEYADYCTQHGVPDRLELLLCDINAVMRGKWLPGDQAGKLPSGDARLPMSTYAPNIIGYEVEGTGLGIEVGDPDGYMVPIPGTLRPIPWLRGNIAQVLVELEDEDEKISDLSARQHLARVLERFADKGLKPVIATELEFYVIRQRERSEDPPTAPVRTPRAQNYDMELLHRLEPILTDILDACARQGLPTDTLTAEYGPGQFEVNFHHSDDVLAVADMTLMFRRLVRGVVGNHGLEATFMAKPYSEYSGNGMHVHVSLLDMDGNNVFSGTEEDLAPMLQYAVAGVLETMPDMQAIFAPHLNSMRRFGPASHAPSAPEWGFDHRGAAVRIPEMTGMGARLEHRICGADVNPYLALAAILGGVLYGLEHKPDLPLPMDAEDAEPAERLSTDWQGIVERFAESEFAAEIFGEEYRHIYAEVRRDEIATLSSIISPIEYRYYLSRF